MMKKYLLIILLVFWCLGAGRMWDYGETDLYDIGNLTWVDQIDSKSVGGFSYCSSCPDGGVNADIICEDIEGSESIASTDCTSIVQCSGWTVTEGGSGAFTCTSPSGDINSDLGCIEPNYAFQSVGDDEDAYITKTYTDTYVVKAQFYFNFVTEGAGFDNGENLWFFALEGDGQRIAVLRLIEDTGNHYVQAGFYVGATVDWKARDTHAVGTGTWHEVEIACTADNGAGADSCVVNLDDVEIYDETIDDRLTDAVEIGLRNDGTAGGPNTMQFAIIGLDDDTLPDDCN